MSLNGVGSVNGVQTEQIKKNVDAGIKQVESTVKQKEDKQKLALALGALGAVGAAAVGIAMSLKKGKPSKAAEVAKDVTNISIIKKLPIDDSIKKVKCGDKVLDKRILAKYDAKLGDKDVFFEKIRYESKSNDVNGSFKLYEVLRDKETNKIIKAGAGKLNEPDWQHTLSPIKKQGHTKSIVKTAKKSFDEAGNEVSETFKNGKLFTKQTTIKNPDGSKQIIVNYPQNAKKIINIAADGTKTTELVGNRFYNM